MLRNFGFRFPWVQGCLIELNMRFNCMCMGRFDASGTSKNDNPLKVLVGHGVNKYSIEIFFRGLQAEIWLFVYILWYF